jgi:hypothetical protein
MAKTRTLERAFWSDPELGTLSRTARLLAAAMITGLADDEGRLDADPRLLKKEVFGYDADVPVGLVAALEAEIAARLPNFVFYVVGRKAYFWLRNFPQKQGIRYVVKSSLPPRPADDKSFEMSESEILQKLSEISCSRDARAVGLGSVGLSSENPSDSRPTSSGRTSPAFDEDSMELKASRHLFERIRANNADAKAPNLQAWAREFDRLFRIDKRPPVEVRRVIDWSQQDSFWLRNILSPAALRKQYDKLVLGMRSASGARPQPASRPIVAAPEKAE